MSRGSSPAGYPAVPLVSYQINRQLSGWNLPPLVIRAFGAHCQEETCALQQLADLFITSSPRASSVDGEESPCASSLCAREAICVHTTASCELERDEADLSERWLRFRAATIRGDTNRVRNTLPTSTTIRWPLVSVVAHGSAVGPWTVLRFDPRFRLLSGRAMC